MATPSTNTARVPIGVSERISEHPFASGTPRVGWRGTLVTLIVLVVVGWSIAGTKVSPAEFITSAPNMVDF